MEYFRIKCDNTGGGYRTQEEDTGYKRRIQDTGEEYKIQGGYRRQGQDTGYKRIIRDTRGGYRIQGQDTGYKRRIRNTGIQDDNKLYLVMSGGSILPSPSILSSLSYSL